MKKSKIKVTREQGLHLREAAKVVKTCLESRSKIRIQHRETVADGCSILDLMSLGAGRNAELRVTIEGPDETETIRKIEGLFEQGGGI